MLDQPIILASASKHRAKILADAGISFEVIVSAVDEEIVKGKDVADLALQRATAKARSVSKLHPERLVLGCDQTLEFDGDSLEKAQSAEEAKARLHEMSGKTHYLHSAFVLMSAEHSLHAEVISTAMSMRNLSDFEIEQYVATSEWQGCVGCYQFENRGRSLFQVDASETYDLSAIIGLPLKALKLALQETTSMI